MKANVHRSLTRLHAFSLLVLFYLVLVASQSTAQTASDWVLRYEAAGEYDSPMDIAFLDDDHAIVTINHGVLVTSDGGATWRRELLTADTVYNIPMTSVAVQNSSTAWICGWFGALYRTTDKGASFEDWSLDTMIHSECVYFLDENTGWIAGDSVDYERGFDAGKGILHQTTDGGATWQVQAAFPFDPDSGLYWVTWNDIDFADPLHGWMAGQKGGMARTTDGGVTWEEFDESKGAEMFCVAALEEDHVMMGGESQMFLESRDGGASWTKLTPPHGLILLYDIDMFDVLNGYMGGSGNGTCLARTKDGGVTWEPDTLVPAEYRTVRAVTRAPNGTLWAVTEEGEIFERAGRTTTAVDDSAVPRAAYCAVFPSPLRMGRMLTLDVSLPAAGAVRADLYDITGRRVHVLFDDFLQAGGHTLNTPHIDLSPGMYIIRFRTKDGVQIVKLPVML
ncbi:MAG: YCF48-related protein [Bacteroidota bacterium]|nr:YCF48-related protein [Bacteroidota bacterium]